MWPGVKWHGRVSLMEGCGKRIHPGSHLTQNGMTWGGIAAASAGGSCALFHGRLFKHPPPRLLLLITLNVMSTAGWRGEWTLKRQKHINAPTGAKLSRMPVSIMVRLSCAPRPSPAPVHNAADARPDTGGRPSSVRVSHPRNPLPVNY